MVFQHDVLVTAAGAKREVTHVVGVELADGIGVYMKFVGAGGWENGDVVERRSGAWFVLVPLFGIRGTDSFSGMSEEALDGFIT